MIRWIVESSMRLRFLIIVIAAVLLVFGFTELRKMPVDVFPEFNPPLVEVQTEALGLSAAEVESLVTLPMEADLLNGVAWLDKMYSRSVSGLSSVLLVFEPGTDTIQARQMVQERLAQAFALPNVSKPPAMLQPTSASNRVMMVGFSSKDVSLIDMSVLARWNVAPRLMGVPGVANVAIWGQRDQQLQVQVDPKALHDKGVTLSQVIETAGEALWVSPLSYLEASSPGTAGWIDTPNQRLSIRHNLPIISPDDLAKVALVDSEDLLLGDVATVVQDHQQLIGDAMPSEGLGLILVIEKFPNANTLDVTKAVEDTLNDMRPGLTGIDINTSVFRPANYIEMALGNLQQTLIVSAVLVLLALLALFFNWRLALVSFVTIVLSLVMGGYVLYLRGATAINIMVVAGFVLALAVLVDDAIVDVDNIAQRLRQQRAAGRSQSTFSVVLGAVMETRSALIFATLIILLAVMPIFFMEGLTGAFFKPLTQSYLWALLTSIVVAMVVVPGLSLLLLDHAKEPARRVGGESPLIRAAQSMYAGILAQTVQRPFQAIVLTLALGLIGLASVALLRPSIMPSLRQTELLIQWDAAPATSRTAMNRITMQVATELRAIAGVINVGSHVGRAVTGDQIVGINSGELWVSLDPAADYDAARAAIQEVVDGYPGLLRQVQNYQPERTGEALLGPDKDLVVRVYGNDFSVLNQKAAEISQLMANVSGAVDVQTVAFSEEPQVEIEVKLDKAEQYHVKPGDVRRAASALISGIQVGNLYEGQKVFDVVVWGLPEIRSSLSNIRDLLIDTPDGNQVPLSEIADVRIVPSPTIIQHDSVSRFIDVTANVTGRSLGAVTADIKAQLQALQFPMEHHAEVLADSAARQAAQQRQWGFVVAAIVGIFLLLQAASGKWSMALATFVMLLVALSGGAIAAVLGGRLLTIGALFGFLSIFAITVRNTLATIKHCQYLQRSEGLEFGPALVVRAASERVGAILTTAIVTILAMLPFVVLGNSAGHEIVRPLAGVVIGGLVTSTLLNLFVLPAFYLRFGLSTEEEFLSPAMAAQPIPASSAD